MVLAAIVIFPKRPLSVLDCLLTGQRLSIFVMIRSANEIASAMVDSDAGDTGKTSTQYLEARRFEEFLGGSGYPEG
jgi:hypothetical protein